MTQIDVTARFTSAGKIIPLKFNDGKSARKVYHVGRQWHDQQGKHILVMDIQRKTYHLVFDFQECVWYLENIPQMPNSPV